MINGLRIAFTLLGMAALMLVLVPIQYVLLKFGAGTPVPRYFHRIMAWLLGFRIHVHGAMARDRPLLLVSNHTSWTDIILLSTVGDISFIAKTEVRDWPLFGNLAVLQRSVFVERDRRGKTGEQASQIATRLAAGDVMVLFAEGTTSDGNRVLPFKSSLFGAASAAIRETGAETVSVQPVAIAYTKLHGMAMGRYHRPIASWPGDVALLPHLKNILKEGAIDVDIRFGEPTAISRGTDRKRLAGRMEAEVRSMLLTSLMGREMKE